MGGLTIPTGSHGDHPDKRVPVPARA